MYEALYLHIPFCTSRCSYCDFATSACHDEALMDAYVDALSLQLRRASREGLLGGIKTIYIGGGTPTHLGSRRLSSLIYLISLSVKLEDVVEFTLEANPESLTERMVKDLYALGVDRVSLGVQSLDDEQLRFFGRAHSAADAQRAIAAVQTRIENLSVDLICGAPGMSMVSWEASVREAIVAGAKHVSVYPLTIEDGTPLAARVAAGQFELPDEDTQADMMLAAERILNAAGMQRYEVASYAYPGFESKHNSAYWSGVEYLGLGAAAASMRHDPATGVRIRTSASPDVSAFIASQGHPELEVEELSPVQAALEDLMLALRMTRGIPLARIEAVSAQVPNLESTLASLVAAGLIRKEGEALIPTQKGWLCGNELYGAIWDLAI